MKKRSLLKIVTTVLVVAGGVALVSTLHRIDWATFAAALANVSPLPLAFATCIGVGAITGLVLITALSESPKRALLIKLSMTGLAVALIGLAFARTPWMAYPFFVISGMSTIIQFNTTNALFQLIRPKSGVGGFWRCTSGR